MSPLVFFFFLKTPIGFSIFPEEKYLLYGNSYLDKYFTFKVRHTKNKVVINSLDNGL